VLRQYILQAEGQISFTSRLDAEESHWLPGSSSQPDSMQVGWLSSRKHWYVTKQIPLSFSHAFSSPEQHAALSFSPWLWTLQIPIHTWTVHTLNSQHSGKESALYSVPLTSDVLCIKMVLLEPAVQILIRRIAERHASRGQRHTNSIFYCYPTVKTEKSWCTARRVNESFCGRWRCRTAKGSFSSQMPTAAPGPLASGFYLPAILF